MAPKSKRLSKSTRAGIIFPVTRMHRQLKSAQVAARRVTKGAAVYLAAVTEYLVAEMLELSGNAARHNKRTRIVPRHILLAVASDEELDKLLKGVTIAQGGVLPSIHPFLLRKFAQANGSAIVNSTSSITIGKPTKPTGKPSATTPKKKPLLTKGAGSFTVYCAPKSKAAALKGTALTTLSERVLNLGQKLTVVQGNIVNIKADAIVHPTNNSLYMGGEVGNALAKAGGQQLRDAVSNLAKTSSLVNVSDVSICDARNLSVTKLIHVHSPTWSAGQQAECIGQLDKAVTNILHMADANMLASVALPSVSIAVTQITLPGLACSYIFHCNGPLWKQDEPIQLLGNTVEKLLSEADKQNIASIALPSIGSGRMDESEQQQLSLTDTFCHYTDSKKHYILKLNNSALTIIPLLNTKQNKKRDENYQDVNQNRNGDERRIIHFPMTSPSTITISTDDIYGCLCMRSNKQNSQVCHITFYLYSLIEKTFRKKIQYHRSSKTYTYQKYNNFDQNYAEMMEWHRLITQIINLKRNLPSDLVSKRDKRLLVFINPAGGSGKAYKLFMEGVVGVFSEAELPYHVIITDHAGHAKEYVQSIDLNEWYGIVLASGDGLVFEIINGLMSRPDWLQALKLPIGHLPCGSGNAFITNILRCSKQVIMDSMEKFVIQAAVLIATHNVVPMDIAVIDTIDGQRLFSFLSVTWAIIADVDCEMISLGLDPRIYDGTIYYLPYDSTDSSTTISYNYSSVSSINQLHRYLLPLNEEITIDDNSKWRRINGPFLHVLVSSKPCISKDAFVAPQSTLADGYLTLQFIRSGATRINLAQTFSGISTGKYIEYDFVEWMRVKAFRIVPNTSVGNMMVDGERIPCGPVQGETLPGIVRCMGKLPNSQRETS
ncbi:unnamed protein product [Didymodactylos carnosus]|uniref:Histone H2A n=1 Tax=Didymodactylos carnosus TaxID=1234261 RepID=A0A8S2HXD1_9BILA|nr:unnamed protein product [Didymodactylos carnosus]CAF3695555.1 unnamed protein product [Didymodactylos carnosus]